MLNCIKHMWLYTVHAHLSTKMTYIHTYIHACIQTCHAYIHKYIRSFILNIYIVPLKRAVLR